MVYLGGLATYTLAVFLSAHPPLHLEINQMECMMEALIHEAIGEDYEGKIAVANVILNRVESHRFPDSICGVVHQPKQFSYRNGIVPSFVIVNKLDQDAFGDVISIAYEAAQGSLSNVIGKLDHYYNPDKATPSWASHTAEERYIGRHRFVRLNK